MIDYILQFTNKTYNFDKTNVHNKYLHMEGCSGGISRAIHSTH